MQYTDLWPAIQADIFGVISADPVLGNRAGVLVEPGDLASNIQTKITKVIGAGLDGKNGVGFLVRAIEHASDENPSVPFGPLKLSIIIQWCENVTVNNAPNGTGVPIRVYAALTAKILKLYTPVGLTASLVPADPVIAEFTDPDLKNIRVGQVEFHALEADFKPMNRLSRPQITFTGSAYPYTVTVTALPQGGLMPTVYYTLDGSHPYAGNPQAFVYTQPVAVTQGCLFRARAFADGWVASDTQAFSFS